MYCNVTGIPNPTVVWTKVKTGEIIEGNPLNITNINRTQDGEYRCTANNLCGEESAVANIDVQCKKKYLLHCMCFCVDAISWSYYY